MGKKEKAPMEETANQESAEKIEENTAETEKAPEQAEEQKLRTELAQEKDKYIRLAAEYDNFRKRSAKERENVFSDARSDTILRFLPVYDNLARALAQETVDEAYRKGVEMTMTQLRTILEKLGVVEIPAVGETFDPARHNAVMHVEDEELGESVIVEEFEKGFMLGDRVIRFSMVKVAN